MKSLVLSSKTLAAFVAGPNRVWRQALSDHILLFLISVLVAFATSSTLKAQNKNRRAATAKAKQAKAEKQKVWIVFEYYPAVLVMDYQKSELAFVAINSDGSTQAVRYGPYNPTIIGVYEGKLPKAEVALLLDKVRIVIPKASRITKPYVGSCDSNGFQLSVTPNNDLASQTFMPDPGCLMVMPKDIAELVEQLRTIWMRLYESPLAFGYIKSFSLSEEFLKSPQRTPKQSILIEKIPPKLRAILRNARKQSPKFYAVTRTQYEQLTAFTRYPSHPFDFTVVDNGRGYSITLAQSRKPALPPSKEESSRGITTSERSVFFPTAGQRRP
jgi:hypothetical protein